MKKLRLDLGTLAVESFGTTPGAGARAGTVRGREDCPSCGCSLGAADVVTCDPSCDPCATCDTSCAGGPYCDCLPSGCASCETSCAGGPLCDCAPTPTC